MNIDLNILAAWVGILLGTLSGVASGIFFHEEHWLGGYESWRRRLVRLGHVAFFELGLLNLAWVFTVHTLRWSAPHPVAGIALAGCGSVGDRPTEQAIEDVSVGENEVIMEVAGMS